MEDRLGFARASWSTPGRHHIVSDRCDGLSAVRRAIGAGVLTFVPLCVGLSLAGCTTSKPFAQLEGYRWNKTEINTYDAVIVSIDGKSYPYNDRIIVEPGQHHLVLQARPAAGFRL